MKKDIGPQFLIVSGIIIILGVIFVSIKNFNGNGQLFSFWHMGLFLVFGLLVLIKGIKNEKSKTLNVVTSAIGTGLSMFVLFSLLGLVVLIYFLSHLHPSASF